MSGAGRCATVRVVCPVSAGRSISSPLKKSNRNSPQVNVVSEVAIFPRELALAKPVAHDEITCEQLFNRLLEVVVRIADPARRRDVAGEDGGG